MTNLHLHITWDDIDSATPSRSPVHHAAQRLFGRGWKLRRHENGLEAERPPSPSLENHPVTLFAEYPPRLAHWLNLWETGTPMEPAFFPLSVSELQPA